MATEQITLRGPTQYNTSYPPKNARKGYVAKITGRASGALKYRREFLGETATLVEGDTGLYERQIGEKKGGYTRYYHVVLDHPEFGLINSVDCASEVPKLAKLLEAGHEIKDIVEVSNLRQHSPEQPTRTIFDAKARTPAAARKAAESAPVDSAVDDCWQAIAGLPPKDQKKVLAALRTKIADVRNVV